MAFPVFMETTIPLMTRLMLCLLVIKTFADNASAMYYTPQNMNPNTDVVLRKQHFLHGSTRFQLKTGTDQMLRMVPDVTDDSTMDTELIKTVRWRNFEQITMFQATSGPKYLQHDCGCLSRFILCCIQILPIDHIASFSRHFKHTEYPITANNSIDR